MGRLASFAFSDDGSLRRGPLLAAWLGQAATAAAMVAIAVFVIDPAEDDPSATIVAIEAALLLIYLACVAASAYLGIRRLRQRGLSGWWCLVCLIPIVGPPWYIREVLRGAPASDGRRGA